MLLPGSEVSPSMQASIKREGDGVSSKRAARPAVRETGPWWTHAGLTVAKGRLLIAGRDAETLARGRGTPIYVYDLNRVGEQIEALQGAIRRHGLEARVRLALKAQHEPEILDYVRRDFGPGTDNGVGLDVCSPGEVQRALECGWPPEHISYTGTNVSERDLEYLARYPIHINVDGLSQMRRVCRSLPGQPVGLRVNPQVGAAHGMGATSLYAGSKPTKFGVCPDKLGEAAEVARAFGTSIVTVHAHVARMILDDDLANYEAFLLRFAQLVRTLQAAGCPVEEANVGGGLGVPTRPQDRPLNLDAVVALWKRHLEPLGVVVGCESGEFYFRESAVLLAEVVSVEDKAGVTFVGLDVGWNAFNLPFIFNQHHDIVLAHAADSAPQQVVTIAGHINQGPDLFAEDYPFPEVGEGDIVAIVGAGAYGQSAGLDTHCLRPQARAVFFSDRIVERPARTAVP